MSADDTRQTAPDDRPHQAMGPGKEFDTIRRLMARWGDLARDIGDDAAVIPNGGAGVRVISTDACVENAHFQRAWISPREVGHRAAAAAISDVAAMGARADALLIAMVIPDSWRGALDDIADGIGDVVRAAGAHIIGGNLSRGDAFSITSTAIGSTPRVVSRNGAKVGDILVVTGVLGGPGQAIRDWLSGQAPQPWARHRFAYPQPRLAEGAALARAGATAMIDISDGLAADARHLAAASSVTLQIQALSVPCGDGLTWAEALVSGEEYELLATVPAPAVAQLLAEWPSISKVPLAVIGEVIGQVREGSVRFIDASGAEIPGNGSGLRVEFIPGHDHFTG